MLKRFVFFLALIACSGLLLHAGNSHSVVVQTDGRVDVGRIATTLGATRVDSMGGGAYAMSIPWWPSALPVGVTSIEADGVASLPALRGAVIRTRAAADWYKNQPALRLINLASGLRIATGRGVIIADINSAVDVNHPALRGHLIAGADFVGNKTSCSSTMDQSSASFLDQSSASFLDQSSASFLDQSSASFLDQSSASFLDQSSASFLDQSSPAHGHGTMVAGILAVMAPDAMIMPIRAFDDNGCADMSGIARAVRYAVANGARVINMSFGVTGNSSSLRAALDQAARANVVLIASAGNSNVSTGQAPASFASVAGVAATDLKDKKAVFSNYGVNVTVDAPGVNIISAFPGGYYAVLSGTSFAAPMVSGEAALLRSASARVTTENVTDGVIMIDRLNPNYSGQLGTGRIDILRALMNRDR